MPLPVAIAGGLLATTLVGVLSGFLVAVLRVEAILATLGTLLLSTGAAKLILGPGWIVVGDDFFASLARDRVAAQPARDGRADARCCYAGRRPFVMQRTPFGRSLYAIGNNPRAARARGPAADADLTIGAFAVAGLCSGIAGLLLVAQLGIISQGDAVGLEFEAITAALIGGLSVTPRRRRAASRRRWSAPFIVGMLANYQTLKGIAPEYQDAVLGGILLAGGRSPIRLIRGRPRHMTAAPPSGLAVRRYLDLWFLAAITIAMVVVFWLRRRRRG